MSGDAMCAGPSPWSARRLRASGSSTTSTPRERPWAPRRPSSGARVPAPCTWSRSRGPCAADSHDGHAVDSVQPDEEALVRLQVKGKNVEVSDSLKDYAVQKLGKLDKHLNDAARLERELQVEKTPSIAENRVGEAWVWRKGPIVRAGESSTDMKASIDQLVDKPERQARRY